MMLRMRWNTLTTALVGAGLICTSSAMAQPSVTIGKGGVTIQPNNPNVNVPNNTTVPNNATVPNNINRNNIGRFLPNNVAPNNVAPNTPYNNDGVYDPNYGQRPNVPGTTVPRQQYVSPYNSSTQPYAPPPAAAYQRDASGRIIYQSPSASPGPYVNEGSRGPRNSAYLQPAQADNRPAVGITLDRASEGVKVDRVHQDSPADKAGLKAGDIIRDINGQPTRSMDDVVNIISAANLGDVLKFHVLTNGQEREVTVGVGTRATALQR